MESVFTPPRGLDRSRPREIRLTAGGRVLACLIALLFAGAPTAALFIARAATAQRVERQRLVEDGVRTQGVVTRLWRSSGKSKEWRVAYRFEADGRTYTGQSKIPRTWSQSLREGGGVPVRFVRDEPGVNLPGGLEPSVVPLWLSYLVALVLAALGLMFLVGLRREQALLADGRVAGAVVTKLTKQRTQQGASYTMLQYEFPLLSGVTVTGKSGASSKPPAIGSVIPVLYDPERPTRNKTYPLALVRLAEE